MGADKQGSKGGGSYVGGFLQLFDWNAKSRKKLFSNKSELPERSKQGEKNNGNFPMTRLNLIEEDASVAESSIRVSSEYSCASSMTDDEAYVSKAPGVVARLMGLDSLPTSNCAEPYSTPFFDIQSLRDAHYQRINLELHPNHHVSHSGNLLNKVEAPIRNTSESKPFKMPSRPIEKFQTEILPPKSAKSIPITHHKLLSPIKNHSFTPAKNVAQIMEAAAKIIDPGPQAITKAKMPLAGSSSIPLKVRDLKEKAEAAQKFPVGGSSSVPSRIRDMKEKAEAALKPSRLTETSRRPVESNAAKYLKGQSLNKSWDGPDTTSFRVLPDTGESSADLKSKGKSISLAIQAKVNVQRREGLNSSAGRSMGGQIEQSEVKSSQTFKIQANKQKSTHKKSQAHNASGVLTRNNQKQNCLVDKNKLPSKPSISVSQGRKPLSLSGDSSFGQHRTSGKLAGSSKTGSRKMGIESTGDGNEVFYSSTKNFPRKKRIIDRGFHFEKDRTVDYGMTDKYEMPFQSNPLIDSHFHWAEDSRKKGIDVVSFTFTAPMTRSMHGSERSNQVPETNGFCTDYWGKGVLLDSDRTKLSSSLGYNVIGSDALSILLEQKLREVAIGVGSSGAESVESGSSTSSASILQHLSPTVIAVSNPSKLHDKMNPHGLCTDNLGSHFDSGFSSNDDLVLRTGHKFQGMDEMDACSSDHIEAKQLFDCRHPSPVSILESAFSTESCNSSDSNDSNITEGSKQCSSFVQAQETLGLGYLKKLYSVEADAELSDSASSTSIRTVSGKQAVRFSGTDPMASPKWELEYVKEILCNVELMFKDLALGRVSEIINPRLFDQLENRKGGLDSNRGVSWPQRKVLFDCVGECLDIRCRRYVGGGCRTWAKGVVMVRRKERLAEEVYKEISGWGRMGDSMVDELVDTDMSSQYGKWADFEVEASDLGLDIENRIFNSLVNEVVADILRC